jgi:hypothetical protein
MDRRGLEMNPLQTLPYGARCVLPYAVGTLRPTVLNVEVLSLIQPQRHLRGCSQPCRLFKFQNDRNDTLCFDTCVPSSPTRRR